MLSKQVKIFHDYYEQIQKFIPKKKIYCDDMYSNRYNFFISKDDYSNEIQYQLDTILADMCTSHYDPKTDMSLYSILIVPQKIIDNRQSLIAEDFFKQKTQDYIASNTVSEDVPQKTINNRPSLIVEYFFNQKTQDYSALNTPIEVAPQDKNGFKRDENLEMLFNPIDPTETVELGVDYVYAA